jgi:hypothetical protein
VLQVGGGLVGEGRFQRIEWRAHCPLNIPAEGGVGLGSAPQPRRASHSTRIAMRVQDDLCRHGVGEDICG